MADAPTISRVPTYLKDLEAYCSECLTIRAKSAELTKFKFNPSQLYVQGRLGHQRKVEGRVRALLLKARQLGMSTLVAGRNYRAVHLRPQINASVIADKKERAGGLFGIYRRFDQLMPDELRIPTEASARGRHLVYKTGSEIHVETAGDTSAGRSQTIQMLHMSEMAFWPNADDVFVSMMQAVPDSDSEVIIESTANGVGGLFYELWQAAQAGENSFDPIFLPWFLESSYRVPVLQSEREMILSSTEDYERQALDEGFPFEGGMVHLSPEQLQWRRLTIRDKLRGDDRAFRQEYPTTSEEAFLVSGAAFFDELRLLDYARAALHTPPVMRGNMVALGGGALVFRPAERGPLKIWSPPQEDERYVLFADTAEGRVAAASSGGSSIDPDSERGGRDFSAACVLAVNSMSVVATLHGRMGPDVFARDLERLSYYYPWGPRDSGPLGGKLPGFIGVERNGASGETVARILKEELRHPNLFYARTINRRTNRVTAELGWRTTGATRMPMLDDLASAIRTESIAIPDAETIREMFTFVRGDDGRPEAQAGAHDDRVIALAGAVQMRRYAPKIAKPRPVHETVEVTDSPTGMFDY